MLCGVLIFALSVALGMVGRTVGFVVVLAALLIGVEAMKGFAGSVNYKIVVPEAGWNYSTYQTLDDALAALQNGEIRAVIADENDLEEMFEADEAETRFMGVQLVERLTRDETRLGLPVQPALPARFGVVVRDSDAGTVGAVSQLLGDTVGAVAGDPAETNFLSLPRAWQLIDLRIFNNLNMPHLQSIASAFTQPARRNGPVLLARILAGNAVYTWSEAALDFRARHSDSAGGGVRAFAAIGARPAAVCGRVANGADPRDRANGGDLAGGRANRGGDDFRVSDVLSGDDQHAARPDLAKSGAGRSDALIRGVALDDFHEAAASGGGAVYFHGVEGERDGQRSAVIGELPSSIGMGWRGRYWISAVTTARCRRRSCTRRS